MDIYIYGKHAVLEALEAGMLTRVLVVSGRERELESRIRARGVSVQSIDMRQLPREIDREAAHQGVIGAIAPARLMREYKDFIKTLEISPDTSLVVLGEVQDPQNVGAIIRSAAAFGCAGVLIPEHNQAQVTGAVIKVSAGMAFRIPLISVGNVNTALRDLKERGFWIYGLDEGGTQTVDGEVFDRPAVFVLGNEGKGMREKTRDTCDIVLRIPIHPRCESLNVSAAAAVVLAHWSAAHGKALAV